MANTTNSVSGNSSSEANNIDLYKNQLNYEKYVEKKMTVYSILFVISSVLSLITMFMVPIFRYRLNGNVNKGIEPIYGDYSLSYLITKFFKHELGENSLYTVGLCIAFVLAIVCGIYLVAGAVVNFVVVKLKANAIIKKIFNLGYLEFAASAIVVLQFLGLLCSRISINGAADNLIGFWLLLGSAVVMICTSIPLSTYRKYR